jgi:hypothetical protein
MVKSSIPEISELGAPAVGGKLPWIERATHAEFKHREHPDG